MQARQEAWDSMSLNGRSWFAWPSSGRVREQDGAAFKQPVSLHWAAVSMQADNRMPHLKQYRHWS